MRFKDLLDSIAHTASDTDSSYRDQARLWLNLARQEIRDMGWWRRAVGLGTITTNTTNLNLAKHGIFSLSETDNFSGVVGEYMFDETAESSIKQDDITTLRMFDPDQSVTGPPQKWAFAYEEDGEVYIYLWPTPTDSRVIKFYGYKELVDITSGEDNVNIDPYFGLLSDWGYCFRAGMQYYKELDDNEDANQTFGTRGVFHKAIRSRLNQNRLTAASTRRLKPIGLSSSPRLGRLDPAHFDNSGR